MRSCQGTVVELAMGGFYSRLQLLSIENLTRPGMESTMGIV